MPNFIFAYHGGKMPDTPEEGQKVMAAWGKWFESMGDAVVDPGNPVGKSSTVSSGGVADNGGANPLSGYSIVKAADKDAAISLARGCPQTQDGTVEVCEIVQV